MSTGNEYLAEIENTYQVIEQNFDRAFAKCADENEKNMLISGRDAAKTAFWTAVGANLKSDSPSVEKTLNDLKSANVKLKKSLKQLNDADHIIKALEEAVRLAAALAAMAA